MWHLWGFFSKCQGMHIFIYCCWVTPCPAYWFPALVAEGAVLREVCTQILYSTKLSSWFPSPLSSYLSDKSVSSKQARNCDHSPFSLAIFWPVLFIFICWYMPNSGITLDPIVLNVQTSQVLWKIYESACQKRVFSSSGEHLNIGTTLDETPLRENFHFPQGIVDHCLLCSTTWSRNKLHFLRVTLYFLSNIVQLKTNTSLLLRHGACRTSQMAKHLQSLI